MRRISARRVPLLIAFVVAALATAFFASTASAGTIHTPVWASTCGDFAQLNSLDRLAGASTARGDEAREPSINQTPEDPGQQQGRGRRFRANVPVYVHVVSPDGVIGNLSNSLIQDQIQVLNMTFGGFEGGYATGFSFTLAGVTRTVNADWFYASFGNDERDMKRVLHQGGNNALNLYLTTAGPYLGWSYFPNIVNHGNAYLDGIVIDWESLRGASTTYAGRYDQGETATHETGHWLNLEHTFEGACNRWGDHVDDTPPEATPTSGCPAGKDTCSDPGLDPIHNYMDYSYDQCYTEFTAGQAARMQDAWLFYRAP
ncbi:MAG: zinc metalloprotease [Actinobacteria bacterium]|nr:MAG: zinc metalloprotease [Actinomycetota bacterium]